MSNELVAEGDRTNEGMTDSEIIKLCAESLESKPDVPGASRIWGVSVEWTNGEKKLSHWIKTGFDPLHDDAQCFALLKRFPADCREAFETYCIMDGMDGEMDFNRAICECVAKMQAAK